MDNLFVVLGIASLFGFLAGLVMLFLRRHRSKGWKVLLGSFIIFAVSGYVTDGMPDRDAQRAGYLNASDQELAEELGYSSAEDWGVDRERVLAERHAEAREATEARQERLDEAEEARLAAEAAERARIEAERLADEASAQTAEAERRAAMAVKTTSMAEAVFQVMRDQYAMEPIANSFDGQFCREDGYCDFNMGSFRITIYGAGIAEVETTSQARHSTYREVCSAVLSALTGSNLDFSADLIEQAFRAASDQGQVEADFQGVQITIRPSLDNIYGCRFFTY